MGNGESGGTKEEGQAGLLDCLKVDLLPLERLSLLVWSPMTEARYRVGPPFQMTSMDGRVIMQEEPGVLRNALHTESEVIVFPCRTSVPMPARPDEGADLLSSILLCAACLSSAIRTFQVRNG